MKYDILVYTLKCGEKDRSVCSTIFSSIKMEVESNKGKRAFIFHGNKYRSYYISKVTGIESWRCTQKICKARIQTKSNEVSNKTELYKEISEHNHSEKTTNVAVVVTRIACKRMD